MNDYPVLVTVSPGDGNTYSVRINEAPTLAEYATTLDRTAPAVDELAERLGRSPEHVEQMMLAVLVEQIAKERIYQEVAERRGVLAL